MCASPAAASLGAESLSSASSAELLRLVQRSSQQQRQESVLLLRPPRRSSVLHAAPPSSTLLLRPPRRSSVLHAAPRPPSPRSSPWILPLLPGVRADDRRPALKRRSPAAQMQPRLVAVAMSLVCEVIRMSSGLVQKQSAHREAADDCRACLECSRDNGCVRCPEKLFLFLQRDGMSHHGSCVHACPAGHYGQRGTDANRCMKCRSPDCEHCFSRDFCTKCKAGLQLYKGRCLSTCPEGTHAHQTDCRDDCAGAAMSEWSQWSTCLHDGAPCGFRWGKQTRSRNRTTEEKAAGPCWTHSETQRCRMKKKCPTERSKNKKERLGRKRGRKRQQLLSSGSNVGDSPTRTTDAP